MSDLERDAKTNTNPLPTDLRVPANTDSGDITKGEGSPVSGSDLRLKQEVADTLASTPGGVETGKKFGIGTDADAVAPSLTVLDDQFAGKAPVDPLEFLRLSELLSKAADQAGVDPDVLRRLRRPPSKEES